MRQSGLTLQERRLIILLRWWAGLFFGCAIIFAVFPKGAIYWLNTIGHVIFNWRYQILSEPSEHFWQILAVSLMVLISAVSFSAQRDIRQNLNLVKFIILSKVVTSAGFMVAYIFSGAYFVYLVGFAVDFIIFIVTWYCYARTVTSRGL